MKKPKITIVRCYQPLIQPACWCDRQRTHPNCPARMEGWAVGSDGACSLPPREPVFDSYEASIEFEGLTFNRDGHPTKKAARAWAKEWCATVGAALMEKGK